jgi:hypothetical protein
MQHHHFDRALLAVSLLTWGALAGAHTREWKFTALLDNKPIGHHNFSLEESGSQSTLTSEARFDVKIVLISFYKYVHDDKEIYAADCLQSIAARTNDNGKQSVVIGTLQQPGFIVSSPQTATLGPCIMTYAYWNPQLLQATQLLNSQTGKFDAVKIKKLSDESIQAHGKRETATKYRITGDKLQIDLWYSHDLQWLGLESSTEGGRRLRYQLD